MGREGLLPRSRSRPSTPAADADPRAARDRRVRGRMALIVGAISGGLDDPLGGSNVYGYLGFLLTLGILPVYVLTNLAAARYFAGTGRFRAIRHGVLPLGGAALMVALLVGQIVEQTVEPYTWLPWVIVVWVVLVGDRRAVAGPDPPGPAAARRRAARRRSGDSPERSPSHEHAGAGALMACVIGIDVGSQSVKAVLVDDEGEARGDAERAVRDEPPPQRLGRAGSRHWEHGLAQAVREVRERARGRAARTSRCSGSPARSTAWWRSTSSCARCAPRSSGSTGAPPTSPTGSARRSARRELIERTGLNPDASHTAPKAMWLRDEEPEHYRAARWLAPVGGSSERLADRRGRSRTRPTRPRRCSTTCAPARLGPSWSSRPGSTPSGCRRSAPAAEVIGPLRRRGRGRARALAALPRRRRHGRRAWRGARRRRPGARGHGRRDRHGRAGRGARRPSWCSTTSAWSRPTRTPSPACCWSRTPASSRAGARAGGPAPRASRRARCSPWPRWRRPGSDGALFLPTLSGAWAPRWNDRMRGCFAGLGLHHDRRTSRAPCSRAAPTRCATSSIASRRWGSAARRSAWSAAAPARRCGCRSRPT